MFLPVVLFLCLIFINKSLMLLAKKLYHKKYAQHVSFESDVLIQGSTLAQDITPHIIELILLLVLAALPYIGLDSWAYQFTLGFIFAPFLLTFITVLSSCMVYAYAIKSPEQVQGAAQFKKPFVLIMKKIITAQLFLVLCFVALLISSPYLLGVLASLFTLLMIQGFLSFVIGIF